MAQRAQNDKDPPNIFRRLNPPIFDELKPLPVFSGIITCDQNADEHQPRRFSKQFINFKIEVVNNGTNKRRLSGSSPDATPFKKPFGPQPLSPDFGCFADCSPLGRQDSVSPLATSTPALMHKRHDVGSEIKEMVGSQLLSENPEHGSSMEPGGKKETKAGDLKPSPTFDYDVDDLLCLHPNSPARFLVDEESCQSASIQTFQDEQFVGLSVEVGTTHVQVEGQGDEVKKEMCLSVKDGDDDRGYFSLSCTNDHKGCGWVNSEQLTANLPSLGTPEGDCHPESSSEPKGHEPAVICGHFIILDSLSASDSEPLSEHVDSKVKCLESCDAEEVWDIGPPIFESSICHGETDKLKAEQSGQVQEEAQESLSEPAHSTFAREDSTVDTSYETSLPLQLQVKSKVVFPVQQPSRSPPVSSPAANRETTDSVRALPPAKRPTQRPVVFSSEVEWEQEERLYVHSVVSHMYEKPAVDNGVTSELQNLMSCVADESKGREWQHPSDLTRRNYRRRFGTAAAAITLDAWRAKNGPKHKRFDKIPKIFERSHFP